MAEKQTANNGIGKGKPGPGRPKGVPNKTTTLVKDAILKALDEADPEGAVAYLKKQASQNPTAFLTLVGKLLPLQVENPDGSLTPKPVVIEFITPQVIDARDD
jgi:hypothetical protein